MLNHNADYNARRDPSSTAIALISLRGEQHAQRRRLWDRGMSSESLKEYAEMFAKRATQLVHEIETVIDGAVDISAWISYFS
jgi:cytochrome P450